MKSKRFFYKGLFNVLSYTARIRLFGFVCLAIVGLLLYSYLSIQDPRENLYGAKQKWLQYQNLLTDRLKKVLEEDNSALESKKIIAEMEINYSVHSLYENLGNYFIGQSAFIYLPLIQNDLVVLSRTNADSSNVVIQNIHHEMNRLKEGISKTSEGKASGPQVNEIYSQLLSYEKGVIDLLQHLPINSRIELENVLQRGWELSDSLTGSYREYTTDTLRSIKLMNRWVYLFSGFVLLVILISYYTRIIHRPIQALMNGAEALSQGDFSVRLDPIPEDEVGAISKGFNALAAHWSESISSLKDVVAALEAASLNIEIGAKELEKNSQQQEIILKSIDHALNQSNSNTTELTDSLIKAKKVNQRASLVAIEGRDSFAKLEGLLRKIEVDSTEMGELISETKHFLSTMDSKISSIVSIADESNLLSINAAMKAEKSGEAGRSFVVVANKVREIADQTAMITLSAEKGIEELVEAVEIGVQEIGLFSNEIEGLVKEGTESNAAVRQRLNRAQDQIASFHRLYEDTHSYLKMVEEFSDVVKKFKEYSYALNRPSYMFSKEAESLAAETSSLKEMSSTLFPR